MRPRAGNSVFNMMVLVASCAGGYIAFKGQAREVTAGEDMKKAVTDGVNSKDTSNKKDKS